MESSELAEARQKIVSALTEARLASGVSQGELAGRIGTKKPNISRIESGVCSPTISTLQQLASGMGKKLKIEFV